MPLYNKKQWSMAHITVLLFSMLVLPCCKQQSPSPQPEASVDTGTSPIQPPATWPTITQMPTAQPDVKVEIPTTIPEQEKPKPATIIAKTQDGRADDENELDFDVENQTGKTMFVTCFIWQRKRDFAYWRWDKTNIYTVAPGKTITIDLDTIPDKQDRNEVFGYLGVYEDEKIAREATYELSDDNSLLDLDLVCNLKGKKIVLAVEKYGSKGEFFEYDFIDKASKEAKIEPELDFAVENKTGKQLILTCFVYEKKAKSRWIAALETKDDMAVWRFDKTPLLRLNPNQIGIIDVDTLASNRDREYVRGYLAVFDASEEKAALDATYEMLESHRKLNLGELRRLKNKKIVIEIEKYGTSPNFIDYVIKPSRKIDFTKVS